MPSILTCSKQVYKLFIINHNLKMVVKTEKRKTQAERTALSDKRMLDAAIQSIVAYGTDKTTLKSIGELAGYSRGLAGYRFGSKAGLLSFVVRSIGEEWLHELKLVTEAKIGLDAMIAATDAHYRFCVDSPERVRAFYTLWFEAIGPGSQAKEIIAGIHNRRKKDVREWVDKGIANGTISSLIKADTVAAQFCASIIGIVYQWLIKPEAMDEIKTEYEDLKNTMKLLLQS